MLVVLGVVLAMLSQLGTVMSIGSVVRQSVPTPPAVTTISPAPAATPETSPSATASPMSPRATPTQTVGPVPVTVEVTRGVVLISGRTGGQSVAGTGMVLTADGLVLTNYHVVRSTDAITVTPADGGRRHRATLVGRDATKDVALLQIEGAEGLDVVTHDADPVAPGDVVVAAGNANGQGYVTAHRGNVLELGTSIRVRSVSPNDPPQRLTGLIETNAPAWPGDSGGPMYDAEGEVLGMTTAGTSSDESTQEDRQVYAVPIDAAMRVVQQIRAGDESGSIVIGPKAYLGVVVEADDAASQVRVSRVEAGTPAARAGLTPGDVIATVDGQQIRTRSELSNVLDGVEPGQTIAVSWRTADGFDRSGDVTVGASQVN